MKAGATASSIRMTRISLQHPGNNQPAEATNRTTTTTTPCPHHPLSHPLQSLARKKVPSCTNFPTEPTASKPHPSEKPTTPPAPASPPRQSSLNPPQNTPMMTPPCPVLNLKPRNSTQSCFHRSNRKHQVQSEIDDPAAISPEARPSPEQAFSLRQRVELASAVTGIATRSSLAMTTMMSWVLVRRKRCSSTFLKVGL